MVKIAVMCTQDSARDRFCSMIEKEFLERGKFPELLWDITGLSPFNSGLENLERNVLWTSCMYQAKELEASARADVVITGFPVICPFLSAKVLGMESDLIGKYFSAANAWMETYDTIAYLRCEKIERTVPFDYEYEIMLENAYNDWILSKKSTIPISIIKMEDIFKEGERWLL